MPDFKSSPSPTLAQMIDRHNVQTFAPNTSIQDMLWAFEPQHIFRLQQTEAGWGGSSACCAILEADQLIGVLLPSQIIPLIAAQQNLAAVLAKDLMLDPPRVIGVAQLKNPLKVLDVMHCQGLNLLTVKNEDQHWQGFIARECLQRSLWSETLLNVRQVEDIMMKKITLLPATTSLLQAARTMVEMETKLLMVTMEAPAANQRGLSRSFLTEADLLLAYSTDVDFATESVQSLVLEAAIAVTRKDSLLEVAQKLTQGGQQQAMVVDQGGSLQGAITLEQILQALDPLALHWQAHRLQQRLGKLERQVEQHQSAPNLIPPRNAPYRVLLIENVLGESTLLSHLLNPPDNSEMSFQVIQVDNLTTAIAQLEIDDYDLVIMDLNLPDSQGLESFETLKPHCHDLPIILLIEDKTNQESVAKQCLQKGAQDYILRSLCEGKSQTEREILMRSFRYVLEHHDVQHQLKQQHRQLAGLNQQLQQEITAKTEIADRLESTTIQVKTIFETIADIVFVIHPVTWEIQRVSSDRSQNYPTRLDPPQATLQFLQQHQTELQPLVERAIDNPKTLYHEYCLQPDTNSSTLWFSASISAVNPHQVIWVAHDITPIKQAQQELFAYQQELEIKVQQRTQELKILNATLSAEINRRKFTEAELRQERNFLSTLFNLAGALFVVLDQHGRIIRFNPACEQLTGYKFDEVFGKYVWDLFLRAEDMVGMMHEFRCLLADKAPRVYEMDWRTKFGQLHRISWSDTVLLNEDGNVRYVISTGMDISDRQAFEMTLKTLNQELESRVEQRTNVLEHIEQNLRRQLAAVDAAVDAIAILQQGNFISVNPAFLNLFGYPHCVSLSGHPWQEILFAPNEQERLNIEVLPQLEHHKSWQGEAIARRQNGTTFIQEISLTVTADDDLICVCRDITTRNEAETKLRATEVLLRAQYLNFPIPTYTWQHRDGDFYLINYNTAAEAANDNQLQEFVGQRSSDIYSEDHAIHQNIRTCFETKSTFEKELQSQYQSPKKTKLLLRYLVVTYVYIAPDLVMVHTQDLTERKRAESEVKESQAFLRQVIDNDPNLIFVKDRQGYFLLANQAVADIYGTTITDLIGKRDADFNSNAVEIEHFSQDDQRTLNNEQPIVIDEEQVTDAQGQVRYFRTIKIPLKNSGENHYSRVLGVASEISQQRLAKIELEKALAQERELNHLKSRFIDTASHEFRTPLTVILGATQILEAYYDQLPEARRTKHLQNIQKNVDRIRQLIDDVLTMSRLESGKLKCERQSVDLPSLCRDLLEEIKLGIGKDHQIELITEGAIATPLQLDPSLLQHILSNLLSNACKYSKPPNLVTLHILGTEDTIRFTITDQGIGIPQEDQVHLFESFYRASNTQSIPGTGLGLNIVQEYVHLHGGSISFTSQMDEGSQFIVTIPINPE